MINLVKQVKGGNRAIRCMSAWTLSIIAMSAVFFGIIRYQLVVATYFDQPISLKLNHYTFSADFNQLLARIADQNILAGIPLTGLLWSIWLKSNSQSKKVKLLLGIGASIAAVILSRGLQLSLPTHQRPLHDPTLVFRMPGIDSMILSGWNSLPSDHACVYFALTAVIWRQSQLLGVFALLLALLGSLPRIYLGYHYPSDIVLGALLGIFIVIVTENYGPETLAQRAVLFEQRTPGMFYFLGFILTCELGTLFGDIRKIGSGLAHYWLGYKLL